MTARPLPRAARHRRTVARIGRRPRRHERAEATLAELRHALRGARATIDGMDAVVRGCDPVAGGVAVSVQVDLGTVTLHVDNERAREMLAERAVPRDVFALVEAVVRGAEAEEASAS